MIFGNKVKAFMGQTRSVVGDVEVSPAGNVVVRVGRENEGGWHQTEHVTMLLDETEALIEALTAAHREARSIVIARMAEERQAAVTAPDLGGS